VQPDDSYPGTGAFGGDERELLRAVRELVAADREMRQALGARMALGERDLRAVRVVIAASRNARAITPRELATELGISTAATTVLLDRLVAAGHVERAAHPTDKRSKVVVATPHAYTESRRQLAASHDAMRAAAAAVPPTARPAVLAFLEELVDVMRAAAQQP
jgi:DNA-binding MarR family transcriptional regulator